MSKPDTPFSTFGETLSTTALCRCWPSLIVSSIWSSSICVLNYYTHGKLSIQPTLITVFGTVLGFVISFRTSSSFDRYNEGRKLWSQIVLNCRIFARTVWFHIPDDAITKKEDRRSSITDGDLDKNKAITLIEKKTVVNLLEAYAVAVKHYMRGEEGIFYKDLYPLVPFLSSCHYSFPAIIHSTNNRPQNSRRRPTYGPSEDTSTLSGQTTQAPASREHEVAEPTSVNEKHIMDSITKTVSSRYDVESQTIQDAELPPRHHWRTAFSALFFWTRGTPKTYSSEADNAYPNCQNNVPLEISLYLTSYISALQTRGTVDDPTLGLLYATLDQLVDALTGLERILTTPIPFSYSSHLWMLTMVYCGALPFQLWSTLEWFTIPASVIACFVFYGFVVAGEEIENPFGYDKNDLRIDHFVRNIIQKELHAITATPAPNPKIWAFSNENNFLQDEKYSKDSPDKIPAAWLEKGEKKIHHALHRSHTFNKASGDY